MTRHRVIHIGMMKCASTTIQTTLKRSRIVDFGSAKALKKANSSSPADLESILAELLDLGGQGDRPVFISHEALVTARPALLAKVVERVAPEAKILLVVRGPSERIKSHYKMDVSKMGGTEYPLEYLGKYLSRFQRQYEIDRYLKQFKFFVRRGNFEILPFEMLPNDAPGFWSRMEEITGLQPGALNSVAIPPRNTSPDIALVRMFLLMNRMMSDIARSLPGNGGEIYKDYVLIQGKLYRDLTDVGKTEQETAFAPYAGVLKEFSRRFDDEFPQMRVDFSEQLQHLRSLPDFAPYLNAYFPEGHEGSARAVGGGVDQNGDGAFK